MAQTRSDTMGGPVAEWDQNHGEPKELEAYVAKVPTAIEKEAPSGERSEPELSRFRALSCRSTQDEVRASHARDQVQRVIRSDKAFGGSVAAGRDEARQSECRGAKTEVICVSPDLKHDIVLGLPEQEPPFSVGSEELETRGRLFGPRIGNELEMEGRHTTDEDLAIARTPRDPAGRDGTAPKGRLDDLTAAARASARTRSQSHDYALRRDDRLKQPRRRDGYSQPEHAGRDGQRSCDSFRWREQRMETPPEDDAQAGAEHVRDDIERAREATGDDLDLQHFDRCRQKRSSQQGRTRRGTSTSESDAQGYVKEDVEHNVHPGALSDWRTQQAEEGCVVARSAARQRGRREDECDRKRHEKRSRPRSIQPVGEAHGLRLAFR
jgi:hypothetical protein